MGYAEILQSLRRIDTEIDNLRDWIAEYTERLEDIDNELDRLLETLAVASDAAIRHAKNAREN